MRINKAFSLRVKLRFFIQLILSAVSMGLPLMSATAHQRAPVEDLSVNSAYLNSGLGAGEEQTDSPVDNLEAVGQQNTVPAHSDQSFSQAPASHEEAESAGKGLGASDNNTPPMDEQAAPAPETSTQENGGRFVGEESDSDRLARLEQQVTNLVNMNLPEQLSQLQQALQSLNGHLQEEEHELQRLQAQQRSIEEEKNHWLQETREPEAASPSSVVSSVPQQATSETASVSPANSSPPEASQPSQSAAFSSDLSYDENSEDALAYHRAFKFLVDKQYKEALVAFNDYITRYKNSVFIANAYYWLGELYLKKENIEAATRAFSQVVEHYPESNKVPDAKLKLAIIHLRQGQQAAARHEFGMIKRQYPGSTAAQLASIQLQTIALK